MIISVGTAGHTYKQIVAANAGEGSDPGSCLDRFRVCHTTAAEAALAHIVLAHIVLAHIVLAHMGGLTPLRPTTMLGARIVPSACFLPATTKIFSPGLRSATAAGSNITTSTLAGTTNFFSPSLYFSTSSLPSLLATALSML